MAVSSKPPQPAAAPPGRRAASSRCSKARPSARLQACCRQERCRRHQRAAASPREGPLLASAGPLVRTLRKLLPDSSSLIASARLRAFCRVSIAQRLAGRRLWRRRPAAPSRRRRALRRLRPANFPEVTKRPPNPANTAIPPRENPTRRRNPARRSGNSCKDSKAS